MESWRGENIYTTDSKLQLQLLNQSTADWRLGFLPKQVTIGSSQDSNQYDDDTLVLWNTGGVPTSSNIFIGAAVISLTPLFIAVLWLLRSLCLEARTLWTIWCPSGHRPSIPRNQRESLRGQSGDTNPFREGRFGRRLSTRSTVPNTARPFSRTVSNDLELQERPWEDTSREDFADIGPLATSATMFRQKMAFYYEPVETKIEEYEKNFGDPVDVVDIESGTELVRQLLACDLSLWSNRNTEGFTEAQRTSIREESRKILDELRGAVNMWDANAGNEPGWEDAEKAELQQIMEYLAIPVSNGGMLSMERSMNQGKGKKVSPFTRASRRSSAGESLASSTAQSSQGYSVRQSTRYSTLSSRRYSTRGSRSYA